NTLFLQRNASLNSGVNAAAIRGTGPSGAAYTSGVLSPPAGSDGSTAASGSMSANSNVSGSNFTFTGNQFTVSGSNFSFSGTATHRTQPTIILNYMIRH